MVTTAASFSLVFSTMYGGHFNKSGILNNPNFFLHQPLLRRTTTDTVIELYQRTSSSTTTTTKDPLIITDSVEPKDPKKV